VDERAAAAGTAAGDDGGAAPAPAADGAQTAAKPISFGADFPAPMLGEAGPYSKEHAMFAASMGRMRLVQRAAAAPPPREDSGGSERAYLPETTGAAADTGLGSQVAGGAAEATNVTVDGGSGAAAADAAEVFEDAEEGWEAAGEPGVGGPDDQPSPAYRDALSLGDYQLGGNQVQLSGVLINRGCWGEMRFWPADKILELVASPGFQQMSERDRKEAFAAAVDAAGGVPWTTPLVVSIAERGALSRGSVSLAVLRSKGMVITGAMLRDPGAARGCAARLLAFAWASSREHAPQLASLSSAVRRVGADALVARLAAKAGCGIGDYRLRALGQHRADVHDSALSASARDAAYTNALRGHGGGFAAAADWVAGAGGQALRSLGASCGLHAALMSL
jgi:hypothetical protein